MQTEAQVRSQLTAYAGLGPPDRIEVRTMDHVVYLYGLVDTEMERELAQSIAVGAAGGDRVVSLVGVSNR
jgi:osmotically-inducible protein OsmY